MKRSPLAAKRKTPRRNEGRVTHARVKPKAGASPDAEERQHMARVASLPCLCCGVEPVTVHHVTSTVHGGRISRSHQRIVGLCPRHHLIQHGPRDSVEALGHGGFARHHGIDLLAEADRLWLETLAM